MSSSSQFPSGLSNWTGADKPTRADFVRDNGILDENALWKQKYDPTGAVAARGGIAEYALDRDRYDQDGSVAAAGGFAAYMQNQTIAGNMAKAEYDPDNSVAEVGGIPTYVDSALADKAEVPEYGVNENGTYYKYSDGKLQCEKIVVANVTFPYNWGASGLFHSLPRVQLGEWPYEFISHPVVQVSPEGGVSGSAGVFIASYSEHTNLNAGSVDVIAPVNTARDVTIHVLGMGRWK